MAKNRIKIESKDLEDNDVVVYVVRPNRDESAKAQMLASRVFRDAVQNGALVRKALDNMLLKQGIWSAEKQSELDKIDEQIRTNLIKLKSGGIKLAEARDLAIDTRIARLNRSLLLAEKNEHDEFTADAQSEAVKFDYLCSVCIKNEEGQLVFSDVDDFRDRSNEPFIEVATSKLASMIYGLEENWESNLPENKFLTHYNFIDEKLQEYEFLITPIDMIEEIREFVDEECTKAYPETYNSLNNAYKTFSSANNNEEFQNVANSCRIALINFSNSIFKKEYISDNSIDLKEDNAKDKLKYSFRSFYKDKNSKFCEISEKFIQNTWDFVSIMVHKKNSTRIDARNCILYTYILISTILEIKS